MPLRTWRLSLSSPPLHFQDIIVVESTRLIVETDRKERDFWADSESDSEGGNFELSNYDTEMGPKASDTWMCQKCHIKNPPMVGTVLSGYSDTL